MADFNSAVYAPRAAFPPKFQDPAGVNVSMLSAYVEVGGQGTNYNQNATIALVELPTGTVIRRITLKGDDWGGSVTGRIGHEGSAGVQGGILGPGPATGASPGEYLGSQNLNNIDKSFVMNKAVVKDGNVLVLTLGGANPAAGKTLEILIEYVNPV